MPNTQIVVYRDLCILDFIDITKFSLTFVTLVLLNIVVHFHDTAIFTPYTNYLWLGAKAVFELRHILL